MRLPRVTVRRLMILVAIAGLLLAAGRAWNLRADYLLRASYHESRARILEVIRDRGEPSYFRPADRSRPALDRAEADRRHAASVAYHEALRRKYEAAARRPWLPVEPDPPGPE